MTEENNNGKMTEKIARMKIFKINEEEYEAASKLVKENKMSWTEAVRYVKISPPLEAAHQEATGDVQKDTQQGVQKDKSMGGE